MPSRLTRGPAATANRPRFELPALDLDFGRITDGTNIPPPPSPVVQKVPTPPQTPPGDYKQPIVPAAHEARPPVSTPPNGNDAAGSKRSDDGAPLSPAGSGRQASMRQLFSRNMLNASYAAGRLMSMGSSSVAAANGLRPESRGTSATAADERKSRRSSGWFRHLRGADSKRSSFYFDDAAPVTPAPTKSSEPSPTMPEPPQKPAIPPPRPAAGPPPPMIPELADLEKDEGSLGRDLFKNIK